MSNSKGRKKPGCFVMGCGSTLIVGLVGFSLFWAFTGNYQPKPVPAPPPPTQNGYDDFIAAGKMFQAAGADKELQVQSTGELNIKTAPAILAKHEKALQMLRQGFGKDTLAPPFKAMNDQMPYLSQFRGLARLLRAEAELDLLAGKNAAAMERTLDGFELANGIPKGGGLIHALVSVAIEAISERGFLDAMNRLTLAEAEAALPRLIRLSRNNHLTREAIAGERRYFHLFFEAMDRDPSATASVAQAPDDEQEQLASFKRLGSRIAWHVMRDGTIKEMEEIQAQMEQQADLPASKRTKVPEAKSLIGKMLMPTMDTAFQRMDTSLIRKRLRVCAMALHIQKLKNRRYPDSLAALGLDAEFITDPITEQPLKYSNLGIDYLLYSIGPDLKDDSGVPANESSQPYFGDMGLRSFIYNRSASTQSRNNYRLVPHMKPPVLAPGSPPLNP